MALTQVSSSLTTLTIQSKSTTYIILPGDDLVLASTAGGAYSLTLPTAAGPIKPLRIKKTTADFSVLTVSRAGSDTIQDVASSLTSTTLDTQGEEIELINDGISVWYITNRRIPSVWATSGATFTIGGLGTVTSQTSSWRREGDSMRARIYAVSGTVPGTTASVTLPLAINSGALTSQTGGQVLGCFGSTTTTSGTPAAIFSSAASFTFAPFYDGSDTAKVYIAVKTTSNVLTKAVGSDFSFSSSPFSMEFTYPVTGWKG